MLEVIPLSPARAPKGAPAPQIPPFVAANSNPHPDLVRFPSLETALRGWIWQHRIPSLRRRAARGCLITGEPGTGKSTVAMQILTGMGFHVVPLPAHTLLSSYEAENIVHAETIFQGAEALAARGTPVVVLIDDIHMVLDQDPNVSRSSNAALFAVWWMHLADNAARFVQADRSPILVAFTSNGFRRAMPAAFREGRVLHVAHVPTPGERLAVIAHHLRPATGWDRHVMARLARCHADMPLSFFAALSTRLDADRLDALLEAGADVAEIERALAAPRPLGRTVLRLAREMRQARTAALNHTDGDQS